jgi:outer membrane protein assembly factor BamB
VIGLFAPCRQLSANDWPRWRGPNIDAVCQEKGLLKEWPESGPPLAWKVNGVGVGYSTVSVVGGKVFTMGDLPGDGGTQQFVIALNEADGGQLWTAKVGPPHGDGSRCTPTVDDGLVYAVGTEGDLVCVEAATGKEVWRKSLVQDFGGKMMSGWKFSESPLIDGDKLVCTPGGREAVMVALNRKTGDLLWKCAVPTDVRLRDGAGYASIVPTEVGGVRQYVTLLGGGLIGVNAKDGTFLWAYPRIANGTANIPTSVVSGEYVFCSTGYQTGAALLKLVATGADGGIKAEEVYFLDKDTFQNHHGGFVRLGDHLYGGHGHNAGAPTCLEMKTGKIVWQQQQPGGGSAAVLFADGNLIVRYQDGVVVLIEATPDGYKPHGQFTPPKERGTGGNAWAHPVIANGKLYLRHRDVLFCYDVQQH